MIVRLKLESRKLTEAVRVGKFFTQVRVAYFIQLEVKSSSPKNYSRVKIYIY